MNKIIENINEIKYYWRCRNCRQTFRVGQIGVSNDPDSGWYVHEQMTGHIVDPIGK